MKKTILSAVFLVLCIASFAQKIRFSNNTNRWSMRDSTLYCCTPINVSYSTAYYDSKTWYKGLNYEHLVLNFGSTLIREVDDKVYFIDPTDSLERVLYDFSLGLNDTMRLVYPSDTYTSWVSQIDSTQLYGTWYKVWHFNGIDANTDSVRTYNYNVIEGIGCTNGVFYPASPYALSSYFENLLCFTNDMGFNTAFSQPVTAFGYLSTHSFDNFVSCTEFHAPHVIPSDSSLAVQHFAQARGACTIVPNPIDATSRIVFPYSISSGKVTIVNELGQVVINTSFQNGGELTIGDRIAAPGIYCYRVTDVQNGKSFSGKFVY